MDEIGSVAGQERVCIAYADKTKHLFSSHFVSPACDTSYHVLHLLLVNNKRWDSE